MLHRQYQSLSGTPLGNPAVIVSYGDPAATVADMLQELISGVAVVRVDQLKALDLDPPPPGPALHGPQTSAWLQVAARPQTDTWLFVVAWAGNCHGLRW